MTHDTPATPAPSAAYNAPTPRTALDELKEHLVALDLYSGLLPGLVSETQAALAAAQHETTVRLLEVVNLLLGPRIDDWIQGRRGMCAFSRERMEELEHLNNRVAAHLRTLRGEKGTK